MRRASPGIVSPTLLVASAYMKYTFRAVVALAAGLAGLASPLQAQEINFKGFTQGCFYGVSESGCSTGATSSQFFLTFIGSTFDVTTVNGLAGIGAAPGTPNVNNLGSFSVTGDAASYTGAHFWLDVIFSTPTITNATTVFTAALRGSVTASANGLVGIRFDPGSQIFNYTSGDQTGDFTLWVNNVSLTPGGSAVALTGDVERGLTMTTTPEPSSMVLMATALAGFAGFVRKRRRIT